MYFQRGKGFIIPAHPIGPNKPKKIIKVQDCEFTHFVSFFIINRHILLTKIDKAIYLEKSTATKQSKTAEKLKIICKKYFKHLSL